MLVLPFVLGLLADGAGIEWAFGIVPPLLMAALAIALTAGRRSVQLIRAHAIAMFWGWSSALPVAAIDAPMYAKETVLFIGSPADAIRLTARC